MHPECEHHSNVCAITNSVTADGLMVCLGGTEESKKGRDNSN